MAYCGPKGIPLSRFLGWPQGDQDAALAWQARESTRCSGCGTFEADWDEEHGGDRNAWVPQVHVCQGCVALERQRTVVNDEASGMRGVHFRLTRPEGR